ncbi:MAG: hypothetical protein U1F23_12890 [Lysobacterales bacterium]
MSMTINGPAPMILAMFMNTAIDQQIEKYLQEDDARWADAQKKIDEFYGGKQRRAATVTCRRATTASALACSA